MVELEYQDRMQWDRDLIGQGIKFFNQSKKKGLWSEYHFEAAIASLHCMAPSFQETNWKAILKLYDQLMVLHPSPYVKLNRNIALFYSGEPRKALGEIKTIQGLTDNHIYLAAMAKIYQALGQPQEALNHYLDAIYHATNEVEKRFLKKKIDALQNKIV